MASFQKAIITLHHITFWVVGLQMNCPIIDNGCKFSFPRKGSTRGQGDSWGFFSHLISLHTQSGQLKQSVNIPCQKHFTWLNREFYDLRELEGRLFSFNTCPRYYMANHRTRFLRIILRNQISHLETLHVQTDRQTGRRTLPSAFLPASLKIRGR